jgi:alanine dehydrogenase
VITLDAAAVDAALPVAGLIDALAAAFVEGRTVPTRHHYDLPAGPGTADGALLLMPAWQAGRHVGIKIVTVFPDNGKRGLPGVFGTYVLLDGTTGQPVAMLDGTMLTARRTAAASGLAARFLAATDASSMVMVGTGALAPRLIRAHATVRPIRSVRIWGRDPAKATALAARISAEGWAAGIDVAPAPDLEAAVRTADVVSCATMSRTALVHGAWLKPGAHLDLVGAYTPEMRECDDEAARRASIFVDTLDGALKEGGDVVLPIRTGVIARTDVRGDLYGLCRGTVAGHTDAQEITLFKSVGTAIEDLAAAQLAMGG